MASQPGFWSVEDRLKAVSEQGDPLEKLSDVVDLEMFRPVLAAALGPSDRSRGGRPSFDAVCVPSMFNSLEVEVLYPA